MGSKNGEEVVQIYTVVEAKTVNELVKLTNIKTKNGWICIGGMCYCPNNICEADSSIYPYCQSMYRMEKPKKEMPVKRFEAFPYDGKKDDSKKEPVRTQGPVKPQDRGHKKYHNNKYSKKNKRNGEKK